MFPHKSNSIEGATLGADGKPGVFVVKQDGLELYDLNDDIGEKNNVADKHPEVMAQLQTMADKMRHELGDKLTGISGTGVRPHGTL
jgi:uncharacterized spore protein YtfJ